MVLVQVQGLALSGPNDLELGAVTRYWEKDKEESINPVLSGKKLDQIQDWLTSEEYLIPGRQQAWR